MIRPVSGGSQGATDVEQLWQEGRARARISEPPATPKVLPDRLGTPEQVERIRKSMESREAAKKNLETESSSDLTKKAQAIKAAKPAKGK